MTSTVGFTPPPYPYDRLKDLRAVADRHEGGCVDLSVGTPTDPPPAVVVDALARSGAERGYPPSIGTVAFREAAAGWVGTRFGVTLDPNHVAACIGTKEFVAGAPHWLRLRRPDRDVVLYPAISYPSYAMGAELAGATPVAVPVDASFRLDLDAIDEADAARALCLWVNTPGNPAGALDDLAAVAAWDAPTTCRCSATSATPSSRGMARPHTILEHGIDGVLAVHSLSKRSNLAGARVGFYAGDPELVEYLSEVRKHAGFMVPGPVQTAAVAAWGDTDPRRRAAGALLPPVGTVPRSAGGNRRRRADAGRRVLPVGAGPRRRCLGVGGRARRTRRDVGQPGRVLRSRRCAVRAARHGAARRSARPRHRTPGPGLTGRRAAAVAGAVRHNGGVTLPAGPPGPYQMPPAQPAPAATGKKVSPAGYWIGGGILVVGCGIAIIWFVVAHRRSGRRSERLRTHPCARVRGGDPGRREVDDLLRDRHQS